MRPFWWNWPSWRVEAIAGVIVQVALHLWGPGHDVWKYWIAGAGISVVYELWFDRHGWSWRDVLERVPGQVAAEILIRFWNLGL
jgi:hypothetical protein